MKATTVWAGVAIGHTTLSFADLAAVLAAVYSLLLIIDWILKKWRGK